MNKFIYRIDSGAGRRYSTVMGAIRIGDGPWHGGTAGILIPPAGAIAGLLVGPLFFLNGGDRGAA